MLIPGKIQASEEGSFFSLYIHIPFCSKKCPYCHFYVLPSKSVSHTLYIETLIQEWHQKIPLLKDKVIYSVYLGGGTPSQLSPELLKRLLDVILSSRLKFHPFLEITLEANPEDLSFDYLKALRQLPINRLSMGVQSFHPSTLKLLERQHDDQKALIAIETAASLGFPNISIDLMYDLPEQTLDSWNYTLSKLHPLPITHLSLYNLTLEPQTLFYKKRKQLQTLIPDETLSLTLLNTANEHLEAMGLIRYEISAFARPGMHSKHNTGYWIGREFLGLGPSAFSYMNKKRFSNASDLKHYTSQIHQNKSAVDFEEELEEKSSLREHLVLALRLKEGALLSRFPPFDLDLAQDISSLKEEGFLQETEETLILTPQGVLFYDTVAATLV
jgi:oxygen-independent coproporphyrinogen III oxidase